MAPLFTLQLVLDVSAAIACLALLWWCLEARSALRASRWAVGRLSRALAQTDVDAQARGYE